MNVFCYNTCSDNGISHSHRIVTKTIVHNRECSISVIGMAMLLFGRIWKAFGLWTRKVTEYLKNKGQNKKKRMLRFILIGDSAVGYLQCGDTAQECFRGEGY